MVARSALILVAGLLLGGCYASTEPATNVGPESAKLNARGTANNGPATSHFEYWITGATNRVFDTETRHWPAGASGPFSAKLDGLAASTSYSFRVCGSDDSNPGASLCGQTRTFTTGTAVEDSATGSWRQGSGFYGDLDAHSGASGQNPRGSIFVFDGRDFSASGFRGFVTCLAVDGRQAAIGAVGQESVDGQTWHPATNVVTVVDNGASGSDTLGFDLQQGSTPPNCASASFEVQTDADYFTTPNELVVNDAP